MRRAVIVVLAAAAVVLTLQWNTGGAEATAARHSVRQAGVLFRWAIPKKGNVGVWKARNGVLSYDGSAAGTALPKYAVPAGTGFAVQAMLRTAGPGSLSASLNGFGLVARESRSDVHRAVSGGSFFNASFKVNEEDNMPELYWNGQTFGQAPFQPGKTWHLYRLEVQGDQYSLFIDGKLMCSYAVPDYPNPKSVGVFSLYYTLQVKQFEVTPLAGQTAQTAFDPVPHDANLTVSDLPTSGFYLPYLQHWYSNEETARELNVSLPSLQQAGRIVSYGVEFFPSSRDFNDIYSVITAYGSAAQARQAFESRLPVLRQSANMLPGAHDIQDLSGLNLGDESGGFRADGSTQGISLRVIVIYYVRGRYTVLLRVPTDPDPDWAPDANKSVQQIADLGRIIDGRLPRS